ncbi:MAG: hypothetical protein QOE26_1792 [Verrucomicrobiota bacterium]|jgi:hypothetical protein
MFRNLLFRYEMLVWAGAPLLITLLVFCCQCLYWEAVAKKGDVKYNLETLRAPINTGVSVSGLILPLLCGAIGYLALQRMDPIKLIPLLAVSLLLGLSMMVGLWNMFSMTASRNDEITITTSFLTWFVPQIVAQLCLLFLSIIVLLIYVFFSFDLPLPGPSPKGVGQVRWSHGVFA